MDWAAAMTTKPVWKVSEPHSLCEVRLDERTFTTVRRHGNPAGPRLVLSHGNGLAIDLYYPFWSLLEDDFDVVTYDLRNHGWNSVGARRDHNVPVLIRDHLLILDAVDRHFGEKPRVGVYHSVSALIALLSFSLPILGVSQAPGGGFAGLVLFDPPLRKPGASHEEFDRATEYAARMTRKRGYRFPSQAEFAKFLGYLPPFLRVVPGTLDLMARTTLRPTTCSQEYELRCPRDYEAQIMDYVRSFSPQFDFDDLNCPAKVVGADPTLPYSYLPTIDLSGILTLDYDFVPEATHLLQLEKPSECADEVREFLVHHRLL